jgi:hypothetical protein
MTTTTETATLENAAFWFENMSDEELLQAIYIRPAQPPLVLSLARRLQEALDSQLLVLQQQGSMRRRSY